MMTKSNLEKMLEAGHFVVTAEIGSPHSIDPETIKTKANLVKGYVDAFNVPDGQAAVVAMASWAACLIGMEVGIDPIVQMTCRDRNRIALQADILGICAFGISNILCLSGDPVSFGNHPLTKPVFDLNSIELIKVVKGLRDEKKFENGQLLFGREPRLFIGAAANPFAEPQQHELSRLEQKITAGADFVQTMPVHNVDRFEKWMKLVREGGLHKKVKIIAGITPITSAAAARYIMTKVPNMDVPEIAIERLRKGRNREEVIEEGIKIATETIGRLREIEGIAGVHIMTLEREEVIPEICTKAGLCPRPAS